MTNAENCEKLSVVLSFRNEEAVIPEFIQRAVMALEQCAVDYEVIFVNDASTDRSLDLLKESARANPRIKVVNMSRRFGVAECLLAGIERARGDAVIYLDCDLQDPPELFPQLVAEWRNGADVVYTVRSRRLREGKIKMLLTGLAYRTIAGISEIKLPVEAGDYRLLSRRVVDQLMRLQENDPFIRGLTTWVGYRQVPVHYERLPRSAGVGHFPIFGSLNPAKSFVSGVTSFSMVPLYAIFLLGCVGCFMAVIAISAATVQALAGNGNALLLWISFALLLWSLLMAALGIIGIYVARIFKDVRGRPRYIVADTIGF